MGRIKRRGIILELILRRLIHRMGVRFRVDHKNIYGRPDILTANYKLLVFVDGDFWHATEDKVRQLSSLEDLFPTNAKFWCAKNLANIERDRRVNQRLLRVGRMVMRICALSILRNPNKEIEFVCKALVRLRAINSSTDPCQGNLS